MNSVKKILLVASFEPMSSGSVYLDSLRQKGYEPHCFDIREEYQKVFSLTRNPLINYILKPYAVRILNNRLLSLAGRYKPDLVFVHKDFYVDLEIFEEVKAWASERLHVFGSSLTSAAQMLSTL